MTISENYKLWVSKATEDPDVAAELQSIAGNDEAIYDRFYSELQFGTAGLRGVIGAGSNRMNIYNVRRTTQGLCDYLKQKYKSSAVAISYDSRIKSDVFAKAAACVLAANGIKAYITPELFPVPVLSFAVRELNCQAGIMVTASHNPSKYNGYKCYGPDGCQLTDHDADTVYACIQKVDLFDGVQVMDFEEGRSNGLIIYTDDTLIQDYLDRVQSRCVNPGVCENLGLKVVYTPLNGAGNKPVRAILKRIGIEDVSVVPEQENPDGNFPTCPYPNPEFREALSLALKMAETVNPDLVLATDPDCDRVGIAVKEGNSFRLMTGNEVGAMLLYYILSGRKEAGTLPKNPVAVKTIVSTQLADKIAEKFGCELRSVLTGFKYIGEQILGLEKDGEEDRFVFGFEESYGYLAGSYVRDKDAVIASMLICEMAAYYRKQGKSLAQVMQNIYDEFGYYQNTTLNYGFEGAAGMEKMKEVMDGFRKNPPQEIAGKRVIGTADYELSQEKNEAGDVKEITLPKSNVLAYSLQGGAKVIVRPSGTEPKIKVYVTSVAKDLAGADAVTHDITNVFGELMKK